MASLTCKQRTQFFGIFVVLVVCICRGHCAGGARGENNGCSSVKLAYGQRGLNSNDVPNKMQHGNDLRVCSPGFTCCTPVMEAKLQTQSRQKYNSLMADKLELLRHTFITRTVKFNTFFSELLENSKRDLHDMFVKTYGLLYQQNAHVFTDLFRDLKNYYQGENLALLDVLDNFFSTLMQKMFVLMNVQYDFDEDYLQCVTEHMDELQPFGDVPEKLSRQVQRAFVAARTFVQGLAVGRDVILEISRMQSSQACERALMKMFFCPYCQALPNTPACNGYCMNVMKGCLVFHTEMDQVWNDYIVELMKVADRLEGPFNIESVVDPIDVKISGGIMNFQENSRIVIDRVFQGCGRPQLGRTKRDAGETGFETSIEFDWPSERKGQHPKPTTAAGTSLDRLVRDIREKVEITRGFWRKLPDTLCNEVAAPIDEKYQCWNGQSRATYLPDVVGYGIINQANNPEVDVDIHDESTVLNQQIYQLKLITSKLKSAYNGEDVEWIDPDGIDLASGSGSGDMSGSGADFGFPATARGPVTVTNPVIRNTPPSHTANRPQPGNQASLLHYSVSALFVSIVAVLFYSH